MSNRSSNEQENQETPTEAKKPTKRVFEGNADCESYPGFQKMLKVSLKPIDVTPFLENIPEINLCTDKKGILKTPSLDKFSLKCSVNLFRDDLVKIKTSFLKKQDDSVGPNTSKLDFQCNITDKLHPSDSIDSLNISKKQKRVSFSEKVTVIEMREYHKCKKCPRIFYSRKSLKSHSRKIHKKNHQYLCSYCNKNFLDRMFFKTHIRMHCDVCECLFPSRAKCVEHKRTVCRILHKCTTCELSFFKQKHLRDHNYDHTDTCYVCDYCKEKFIIKCALSHHIKYLHSKRRPKSLYEMISFGAERLYLCNFCDESSVDRDLIEVHVNSLPDLSNRIIKGRKDYYFCDQCKKNFDTEKEMLVHKWTHFLKTGDESEQKSFKKTDEKFPDQQNFSESVSRISKDQGFEHNTISKGSVFNDESHNSTGSLDNDDSLDFDMSPEKKSDLEPSFDTDNSHDSEVSILSTEIGSDSQRSPASENSQDFDHSNTDNNSEPQPSLDADDSQDSDKSILDTEKNSDDIIKNFDTDNFKNSDTSNSNTESNSDLQASLDANDSHDLQNSISNTENNSESLPKTSGSKHSQDCDYSNTERKSTKSIPNNENRSDTEVINLDSDHDSQDSNLRKSNTEKKIDTLQKQSGMDDSSQDLDMSILDRKRRLKQNSILAAMLTAPTTPPRTPVGEVEAKPKSWLEKMLSNPSAEPSVRPSLPYKTKYKLNKIPDHMLQPKVVLKRMTMNDISNSNLSLNNIKTSILTKVTPGLTIRQLLQNSGNHLTKDSKIASKVLPAAEKNMAHEVTAEAKAKDMPHEVTVEAKAKDMPHEVTVEAKGKHNSNATNKAAINAAIEEELAAENNKFCSGESNKPVIERKMKKTLISKHQCMNCDRCFSSAYCLKRHINDMHYDYESLQCRMCEETFAWPSLLQSHKCIRVNRPEMPFKDARPEIHFENLTEIGEEIAERPTYEVDFDIPEPILSIDAQNSFVQPLILHDSFVQPQIVPLENGFLHPQNLQNSFVASPIGQNSLGQNGFAQNVHTSTPRYNSGLQRRYSLMPSPILPDVVQASTNTSLFQRQLTANNNVQPLLNGLPQVNEPTFLPISNGINNFMPSVNNSTQIPTVANNHVQSVAQNNFVQNPNVNSNPIEQLKNLGYSITIQEVPIEF